MTKSPGAEAALAVQFVNEKQGEVDIAEAKYEGAIRKLKRAEKKFDANSSEENKAALDAADAVVAVTDLAAWDAVKILEDAITVSQAAKKLAKNNL